MKEENLFESQMKLDTKAVNEVIEKLNSLDLEKVDLDYLKKIIVDSFKLIPYHKHYLPAGQKIYRARINDKYSKFFNKVVITKNAKSFTNVIEISNRKAEEILEFGRANIPGVSTFYGSSSLKLACAEVIQDVKYSFDQSKELLNVTVGEWITKKPIILAPLLYSEKVINVRKDISYHVHQNKKYMKGRYTDESIDIHDLIINFFSNQFAKKDIKSHHDYKISAFYSKILYEMNTVHKNNDEDINYDGILYPSVVMNFLGTNISLFDIDLNSKIELKNAYKVICANVDFNSNIPKLATVAIAEMENIDAMGNINWKDAFRNI